MKGWSHEQDKQAVFTGGKGAVCAHGAEAPAVHESQWAAIESVAGRIGCSAQTLCNWVRQAERDLGKRKGMNTVERERLKEVTV